MLEKFFYYASTFAGAGLAFFGINGTFEQPAYSVRQDLGARLEIRDYPPMAAVEASATGATREQASEIAFRLLFGYITGANASGQTVAMTTPVRQTSSLIAMTTPVQTGTTADGTVTMRFFLPMKNAANPPVPTDLRVRLVTSPAVTTAALAFSGNPTDQARAAKEQEILTRLKAAAWTPKGAPYLLGYDPPFTIPFLKRNEVAVEVVSATQR